MGREEFERRLAALVGQEVSGFTPLAGGRNNQLFSFTAGGERLVAKHYHCHPEDRRDRLGTEFRALAWLRNQGCTNLPRPVVCDAEAGLAVYEFVEGQRPTAATIGERERNDLVAFLLRLRDLAGHPEACRFGPASDAVLSPAAAVRQIDRRRQRLAKAAESAPELAAFLEQHFEPARQRIVDWAAQRSGACRVSWDTPLEPADRTLSPSDYGFHNALLRPDATLCYLDFEYFGWDDPAKMIADFLLHPGLNLPVGVRAGFFAEMTSRWPKPASVASRTRIVYPLLGLCWCLIILNEYSEEGARRRAFAEGRPTTDASPRPGLLLRAGAFLNELLGNYREYPFG